MADPNRAYLPTDVQALPTGEYAIAWADGHWSTYSLAYLRRECPCASCRTEREKTAGMVMLTGGPRRDVHVEEVEPQGNYAVKFRWSDGHDTGIYSFEFLRQICPCAACKEARG